MGVAIECADVSVMLHFAEAGSPALRETVIVRPASCLPFMVVIYYWLQFKQRQQKQEHVAPWCSG